MLTPDLQVVPPRVDDRRLSLPSRATHTVLFLCADAADVDALEPIASVLSECDVTFAPAERPSVGAWISRLGLGRNGAPQRRVVERCAERGLALDLRRVPLDHDLVVIAVRDERSALRVDHLCVPGRALHGRFVEAGLDPRRLSVTGSPAADDPALRLRAAENVAAVCRLLLQRPASLREMRFWREVGVLRADW